ncbi:TVP38/TMEM64 family protein [Flammeovirga agarivorans]|uniref:TVP38/TMEM64 family membrane protein n=1 Tax=Flammeovirga agarivorans TaxID=2726742 RepID=A0A7X8SRF2_9BACT|nr:VTT domain-containing protein [Flammeovirga agarivorans]NLR95008.1 VTT domain-containing protein [Flammeovirga agarivorans]
MNKIKQFLKQNASSFSVGGGLSILPIITSSSIVSLAYTYESEILAFPFSYWVMFFIITSITMACALTPTTFIALLTGYFLGWEGLFGVIPSYVIASVICYHLVKWIDQGKFASSLEKYPIATAIINTVHKSPIKIVAFTKVSPILPFALSNLMLAWAKTPLKEFVIGSFIGMLPRTIVSVWVGKSIVEIQDLSNVNSNTIVQLIIGGLIIISIVGLTRVFSKNIQRELEASKQKDHS